MAPAMRTESLERTREPTRERILAAASRLFATAGYDATTVRDIARECEISDPAIYHHFGTKREILTALLVEPPLETLKLRSSDEPSVEALIDDLCELSRFWMEQGPLLRLLFRQALDDDGDTRAFSRQMEEAFQQRIMPPLELVYGEGAERIFRVVGSVMVGAHLDSLLSQVDLNDGPGWEAQIRRLLEAALPGRPASRRCAR